MIVAYLELLFTIAHSVVLSLVYSAILVAIILIIARAFSISFLSGIKNHKMKFWMSVTFILFVALISYRFSYNRDNGLGETLQVPIGYGQHMYCADEQFVYLNPVEDGYDNSFNISNYAIKGNKLCAIVSHEYSSVSPDYDYVVYNMETRKSLPFKTITEYSKHAQANHLPMPNEFKDFAYYFRKFSARPQWKKWLLP